MPKIDSVLLKAKFKGSLLGSLLGDCFGGPFEGDVYSPGMKVTIQKYFDKLDGPPFKAPFKPYSDDTVMTKSVAKCLIEKQPVDYKCLAKLFVDDYLREPRRGYGHNVVQVFEKLKKTKYDDIFKPAEEQFHGKGSYGNGGAMRISPVALYFQDNYDTMLDVANRVTKITHTHSLGVNGAILQCIAVHQSLHLNPDEKLDIQKYTLDLIEKMAHVEQKDEEHDDPTPYQTQLKFLLEFLKVKNNENPITEEEVIVGLGNSVAALHSVPTAIYCFLKAHSGFPGMECENVFRRAIQYAVTLGGDADTIAAMTGAIAGAYFGDSEISKNMLQHCEKYQEMSEMADALYTASEKLELQTAAN